MATCFADFRSPQARVQRPGLLAAVLIVALSAIMPAQAQMQQGGSQAPVTLPAAPVQQTLPAAIDPAPVTEATDPAEAQAPASPPDNAAATDPALPGADAAQVAEGGAPSEPAPSVFEDPAGAISHLLSQPQRRDDLPHDLSPWGMFLAADIVVKAVMLGLAFASLVTWTVWLAKSLEIGSARSRSRRVLKIIAASRNLTDAVGRLGGMGGPAALMLRAAQEEAALSDTAIDHAGGDGLKERVASALNRIEVAAGRQIGKGTGLLATIGSTAPFVGLFGTVWGIMNAFIGISEAQTTNLAVVAPGIAEALLATALGLVAAIPAVIIYNHFVRAIAAYRQLMGDVAAGVERLVSRDLDFRGIPVAPDQRVRVKAAE